MSNTLEKLLSANSFKHDCMRLTSEFAFSHAVAETKPAPSKPAPAKQAPSKAPAKRRPRSVEREELKPVAMPPGKTQGNTRWRCCHTLITRPSVRCSRCSCIINITPTLPSRTSFRDTTALRLGASIHHFFSVALDYYLINSKLQQDD